MELLSGVFTHKPSTGGTLWIRLGGTTAWMGAPEPDLGQNHAQLATPIDRCPQNMFKIGKGDGMCKTKCTDYHGFLFITANLNRVNLVISPL